MFRTRSNFTAGRFISCNFTGKAPVYEERFDGKGVLSLVHTGYHNIVDYVQASLDDTKIYNILERFALGDTSVLQKTKGFYADVSQMPTSLVEVHKFMNGIKDKFLNLPDDLKSKFGNSPEKFLESLSNGTFINLMMDIDGQKIIDPDTKKEDDMNV